MMQRRVLSPRSWPWLMLILALATGCDKTIDPASGDRTMRVTIPGTTGHGERLDERWRECVANNPVSLCDRRFPGGQPFGHRPASPTPSDSTTPAAPDGNSSPPDAPPSQ